jgi:hypothetical protein
VVWVLVLGLVLVLVLGGGYYCIEIPYYWLVFVINKKTKKILTLRILGVVY